MPEPVTVDIDTTRAEPALDRLRRELREQLNQRKRWVPIGDVLRALDQHDDEQRPR